MLKQSSLLLIIFLFFIIIFIFPCNSKIEYFVDKTNEKSFTLKNNAFTFYKNVSTILSTKNLTKITDLKYKIITDKNNCILDISYTNNPIKIIVNDYKYIINIKKSEKIDDVLNIFVYDKIYGSIKNNTIKTTCPEIYENIDIVSAIFNALKIYESVEDFRTKDYDKHFSSNQQNPPKQEEPEEPEESP